MHPTLYRIIKYKRKSISFSSRKHMFISFWYLCWLVTIMCSLLAINACDYSTFLFSWLCLLHPLVGMMQMYLFESFFWLHYVFPWIFCLWEQEIKSVKHDLYLMHFKRCFVLENNIILGVYLSFLFKRKSLSNEGKGSNNNESFKI